LVHEHHRKQRKTQPNLNKLNIREDHTNSKVKQTKIERRHVLKFIEDVRNKRVEVYIALAIKQVIYLLILIIGL
jgi:hypothetical protein